jgi:hypothetical protein
VGSRLLAEYGINRPSTIDVSLQAILYQERNEFGGVVLEHSCSVAAILKRRFKDREHRSLVLHCHRLAMGKRDRHAKQESMRVAVQDLPRSAAHPFYKHLNQILDQHNLDGYVEGLCERFYADDGRPSETFHRVSVARSRRPLSCTLPCEGWFRHGLVALKRPAEGRYLE